MSDTSPRQLSSRPSVAIIGAGPAGLMAADVLSSAGYSVDIYERMPSPARKFLMAGRGGLNLTHTEPKAAFLSRYGEAADWMASRLAGFPPKAVRTFVEALGIDTFVGSSGRVFPVSMKASPVLRAWLRRLNLAGVRLHLNQEWRGFDEAGALLIRDLRGPTSESIAHTPDAVILACGGASWPRLGADGQALQVLAKTGVDTTPFVAANVGVTVDWQPGFATKYAGEVLKPVVLSFEDVTQQGEIVITHAGLEGGPIYNLGPRFRARLAQAQSVTITLDLAPHLSRGEIGHKLDKARKGDSFASVIRKVLGGSPALPALLRELSDGQATIANKPGLVDLIKEAPVLVTGLGGMARAISVAGGVKLSALDGNLMLTRHPAVFVAGEMLDWDAPTGGYLLHACFATGRAAALGVQKWLAASPSQA